MTCPPLGWLSTHSEGEDDEEIPQGIGILVRVLRDAGRVKVYWPANGKEVEHLVNHPPEAPAELVFAEYRPHPAAHL